MRILVTGASGFIGKNLVVRLKESKDIDVSTYDRTSGKSELSELVKRADWVVHLAGVNRPDSPDEFYQGNSGFTSALCDAVAATGKTIPIIYSSSIQVDRDGDYGSSKLDAEGTLKALNRETGCPIYIYRLPNIFGKWAKPNYNSVVATFCYNIARSLPIKINDPSSVIRLVYIDDLIEDFLSLLRKPRTMELSYEQVAPEYKQTVGELAEMIKGFRKSRDNLVVDSVGEGLTRALYSTYVSYLSEDDFIYPLKKNSDSRGVFVEMLKTETSGQFSYFTALPGVTRGGHYHHTKTEKFLVIKGKAKFRFCHLITGDQFEISTDGGEPQVVETVPGWTHDVTNIGKTELICMLWANEIYDPESPDTHACPLDPFYLEPPV
ncbi:NAD-dependent epimerase/dehydratase family protein [Vibrio sp. S4M6]|uniref:UDP-2-acetamido-2,6-beta-L-arabino-hexul-4-ose reductase n=1 Tax=Vibrio sinus TaxID=2946865 RepID=UPI00202A7A63|nr:NAD-dependent epimerase/dehydratase family protein [Vibrio sinus]